MKLPSMDELLEDVDETEPVEEVKKIQPTDPEWDDYVISQFKDGELSEGKYPNVNGLRRVCEVVLGPIVGGKARVVKAPSKDDPIAVVEYEVTVECYGKGTITRVFSSAADAHFGNTDNQFRQYLTAMAETRAEARALRKAMKIKTVSYEEISEAAALDKQLASDVQVRAIQTMVRRKKLNIEEIAAQLKVDISNGIESISYDEARKILNKLNK